MKNQIYEVFGYTPNDTSEFALYHKKNCLCPFMGTLCDGGGNRYQTFLPSKQVIGTKLEKYFNPEIKLIPPGVCSIQRNEEIWVVCPRRVFAINQGNEKSQLTFFTKKVIQQYFNLQKKKIGVWSEVKVKYNETQEIDGEEDEKSFDYTFDYIICEVSPRRFDTICAELHEKPLKVEKELIKNGYTIASREGDLYVEEYPVGVPFIIEIMTSSTSGGNKDKGTTIQNSFLQAIINEEHESPGINYRQVWARMVSQLIVKSQIGKSWGGSTLWILQDSLTNYISRSTDLNLRKLISTVIHEVNILSLELLKKKDDIGCYTIGESALFAGNIPSITSDTDFNKLLQAASIPDILTLKNRLIKKRPRTYIAM